MRHVLFAVLLVGCARGGVGNPAQGDATGQVIDGTVYEDAPDHEFHDAKAFQDAHEFHDAHIFMDAHVYMDAHVFMDACVPVQTQLLQNPNLDLDPPGTLWGQTDIDAAYPLITDQDGIVEQTAPYKAWLGGFAQAAPNTDVLWQDVMVPVGTTSLVLSGYYEVRTGEASGTNFDLGSVSLRTTANALVENAINLTCGAPTTAWTPFQHSFTNVSAGQTVRIYFTSTSDDTLATSFYFDTLSLVATHCP